MCLERPLTAKYAATDSAPLTVMPLDPRSNSCSLLVLLSFSALQTVMVPSSFSSFTLKLCNRRALGESQ